MEEPKPEAGLSVKTQTQVYSDHGRRERLFQNISLLSSLAGEEFFSDLPARLALLEGNTWANQRSIACTGRAVYVGNSVETFASGRMHGL